MTVRDQQSRLLADPPGFDTFHSASPDIGRPFAGCRLKGRIALICGGDADAMLSVARHFAAEGAQIAICSPDADSIASATSQAMRASGHEVLQLRSGCNKPANVMHLITTVVEHYGGLDILVSCLAPVEEPGIDALGTIEATLRKSVIPCLYLMTAALPYLPAGGNVINLSFVDSDGAPGCDRVAAESAICAMTKYFARTAAPRRIRVNAVICASPPGPPPAAGSVSRRAGTGPHQAHHDNHYEIGPACVFLASRDGGCITGETIHIYRGAQAHG